MIRDAPIYMLRVVANNRQSPGIRLTDIGGRILGISYEDTEKKADKLDITIDNYDCAMFDEPAFRKGLLIDVQWGYVGNLAPARRCVIQKITGGRQLKVTCLAESILMNKIPRTRAWTNMRRSDVVRAIAREHGYADDDIEIDDTATVFPEITQARQSDAQFVLRLAKLEGFEFYIDQTGYHWHERRLAQPSSRVLRWFTDMTGEILDFSVDNDITAKKARRVVRGRDPLNRGELTGEASNTTDTDGVTLGSMIEVIDPETVEYNAREATEADVRAASEDVDSTTAQDSETAQNEARGRYRSGKLVAVKLKLDLIGDPKLLAKSIVKVEGLGQRMSGFYYVKTVRHDVTKQGYKMVANLVSDGTGGYARHSRLGDLEMPNGGLASNGAPRNVTDDVAAAQAQGELSEVQRLNPETGRYETVYVSNTTNRPVARRTSSTRVVAIEPEE